MSRKHPPKPVIALVVLALLGTLGWWLWQRTTTPETAALTGAVETTDYPVAALGASSVSEVRVSVGDQVKTGDVLVRLDDAVAKAQVRQARAGVSAARAGLRAATDAGERAVARARIAQAKAGVRLARIQQGYLTIRAPHDGQVSAVLTSVGQVAAPGRSLLTITDPTDAFVRVFVPESQIASVKVGQHAAISADGVHSTYSGTVAAVASSAEFTPNNIDTPEQRTKLVYEVRVTVDDATSGLKAGQPVQVTWK